MITEGREVRDLAREVIERVGWVGTSGQTTRLAAGHPEAPTSAERSGVLRAPHARTPVRTTRRWSVRPAERGYAELANT